MNAEVALGLLEASGQSRYVPAFYQPYTANTLKKERVGLKKARRGGGDDDIPPSDLAQRMMKLAKEAS